jgi:hypothetical protein
MDSTERARPAAEHSPGEGTHISTAFKEVGLALSRVLRSEMRLATTELKESGKVIGKRSITMLIFAVIGALGILPLLAFFVIGLGELLNDNYWLSSLIVAIISFAVGGFMVYRSFKMLKEEDFTFPRTRRTTERHLEVVEENVEDIKSGDTAGRVA